MTSTVDFKQAVLQLIEDAQKDEKEYIDIKSGDIHRSLGEYPDPNSHNMPGCCNAMRDLMNDHDKIISAPPKENGATLIIRYKLPR